MFYGLMIILAILLLVTSIWLWSDLHLLDPPWTFSKTFSQKKSNNFPPTPIFHLSTTHSLNISVTQFTWSSLTNNFPPKYLMREEIINKNCENDKRYFLVIFDILKHFRGASLESHLFNRCNTSVYTCLTGVIHLMTQIKRHSIAQLLFFSKGI